MTLLANDGGTAKESPAGSTLALVDGAINIPTSMQALPPSNVTAQGMTDKTPAAPFVRTPTATVAGSNTPRSPLPAIYLQDTRIVSKNSILRSPMAAVSYATTTNHDTAFVYDDAGDVINNGSGSSFNYDALSMMSGATVPRSNGGTRTFAYLYTADDERIALVEPTQSPMPTIWTLRGLDNHLLRTWHESTSAGSHSWGWIEDEVWRGSSLLAYVSATGVRHYGIDHLGSPAVVTDSLGHPIGNINYDAFGNGDVTGAGMIAYTGQERDASNVSSPWTGALPDYFHASFYSPTAGRFLSVDPIIPTAAVHAPQRWNRYAYVSNNPIRNADPTGKLLEARAGTCDDKTPCYSKVDSFQGLKSWVGADAAKSLVLGKNGQVTLAKGMSFAQFAKFGTAAGIVANLMRSTDRTAAFALSSNVKDDRGNSTSAFTKSEEGGTLTEINPAAFPTMTGGATQTLDTAMAHDLGGHALMDMWGVSPLDSAFGSIGRGFVMFSGVPASEAYAVTKENEYRASQGMDIREFYFFKGDYNAPPGAPKP